MKVTNITKKALRARRFARDMDKAGFCRHETDWEIIRGMKQDQKIIAVAIDPSGKYVWTKVG